MFLKPIRSIFEATPNNSLKRTPKSVTPFAFAKAAPFSAELGIRSDMIDADQQRGEIACHWY